MSSVFTIPANLRGSDILETTSAFWKAQGDSITFDFSQLEFAFPFPSLLLAAEIQSVVQAHPNRDHQIVGVDLAKPAHSYLAHVGFFQHIGHPVGKAPGQAAGGDAYLPITELTRSQIEGRRRDADEPLGSAIQKEANQMAQVLTESRELKVYRPIAYCIREVIRNVFEHAGVDRCIFSGQRFKHEVELAIVDRGRGIRASLGERFPLGSDEEALSMAVRPGVSRVAPSEVDDDAWANSGFGLYVLSELARRTGSFSLCSGEAELKVSKDKTESRKRPFHGTAVRLRISKPKGVNFEQLIKEIIKEGEVQTDGSRASRSSKTV